MLADIVLRQPGSDEAERAESLMELLTPICKAFMTDTGYESSNLGMQVFGGHGYIREHGMEQLVRDGRILQQYEGTNGIQELDLLGHKVLGTGGASLRQFTDEIDAFCAQHEESPELTEFVKPLDALTKEWRGLVNDILQLAIKNPDEAGAASYDFLSYSGYVTYAYLFARMADVSFAKLKAGVSDPEFYKAKIHTARFYFQRLLPRTRGLVVSMLSGAGNLMDLLETDFWL